MMKKFLLGCIFILSMPMLESFVEVICQLFEIIKVGTTKIIIKGNKEIAKLSEDVEETNTVAIGFQTNDNDYYYDEGDDFEDKLKQQIGFK